MAPYSFSPDGRRLAFHEYAAEAEAQPDLWTLPLDLSDPDHPRPGKPEPFLRTPAVEFYPAISPDGRWMAYTSNESGSFDVYVRPFQGGSPGGGKWQVSSGGGMFPVWSRASRQLLYEGTQRVMVVDYAVMGDSFQAFRPRPWADRPVLMGQGPGFDLAPDGKRLVVLARGEPTVTSQGNLHLTILVNFFDELRRRMPPAR